MKLLFIFINIILLQVNFFDQEKNEKFNPALKRLNSLELLNNYVDSIVVVDNIKRNSKEEVMLVNEVMENLFYCKMESPYSSYSAKENFLAFLAGKYIRPDLSAVVIPNDILKYNIAACSQQSIVMMELLKLRGYKVRKLGLNHHFVLEVKINDSWLYFDPNQEILNPGFNHDSIQFKINDGTLAFDYSHYSSPQGEIKPYLNSLSQEKVKELFSKMEVGDTNEFPAKKLRLFHIVTNILSSWITLALIIIALILIILHRKRTHS